MNQQENNIMGISNQQFFEKTVRELFAQGCAAQEAGECMYRVKRPDRVLKCAAGIHIPDHLYDDGMEDKPIETVVAMFPALEEYFPDMRLAQDMQRVHDTADVDYWHPVFIEVAKKYGLDTNFMEGLEPNIYG
jgi:hypothetical protein